MLGDLRLGREIELFGRRFFLFQTDRFTQVLIDEFELSKPDRAAMSVDQMHEAVRQKVKEDKMFMGKDHAQTLLDMIEAADGAGLALDAVFGWLRPFSTCMQMDELTKLAKYWDPEETGMVTRVDELISAVLPKE